MFDGLLTPYISKSESHQLSDISFKLEDIRRCVATSIATSGLIPLTEVASIFRVQIGAIDELCKINNVGTLKNGKRYLRQNELDRLLETYVNKYDAAKILRVSFTTLDRWVKLGRMKIVKEKDVSPKIDLFERVTLQNWINENIDFGEALEILGIPRTTLRRRIEKKQIAVTDATFSGWVYCSRSDVMKLKEILSKR